MEDFLDQAFANDNSIRQNNGESYHLVDIDALLPEVLRELKQLIHTVALSKESPGRTDKRKYQEILLALRHQHFNQTLQLARTKAAALNISIDNYLTAFNAPGNAQHCAWSQIVFRQLILRRVDLNLMQVDSLPAIQEWTNKLNSPLLIKVQPDVTSEPAFYFYANKETESTPLNPIEPLKQVDFRHNVLSVSLIEQHKIYQELESKSHKLLHELTNDEIGAFYGYDQLIKELALLPETNVEPIEPFVELENLSAPVSESGQTFEKWFNVTREEIYDLLIKQINRDEDHVILFLLRIMTFDLLQTQSFAGYLFNRQKPLNIEQKNTIHKYQQVINQTSPTNIDIAREVIKQAIDYALNSHNAASWLHPALLQAIAVSKEVKIKIWETYALNQLTQFQYRSPYHFPFPSIDLPASDTQETLHLLIIKKSDSWQCNALNPLVTIELPKTSQSSRIIPKLRCHALMEQGRFDIIQSLQLFDKFIREDKKELILPLAYYLGYWHDRYANHREIQTYIKALLKLELVPRHQVTEAVWAGVNKKLQEKAQAKKKQAPEETQTKQQDQQQQNNKLHLPACYLDHEGWQVGLENYLNVNLFSFNLLTHLNLSDNQLTNRSVKLFTERLEQNAALTHLDLSHNPLGGKAGRVLIDSGIQQLVRALPKLPKLTKLLLNSCFMDQSDVVALTQALTALQESELKTLGLNNNQLGSSIEALFPLLDDKKIYQSIELLSHEALNGKSSRDLKPDVLYLSGTINHKDSSITVHQKSEASEQDKSSEAIKPSSLEPKATVKISRPSVLSKLSQPSSTINRFGWFNRKTEDKSKLIDEISRQVGYDNPVKLEELYLLDNNLTDEDGDKLNEVLGRNKDLKYLALEGNTPRAESEKTASVNKTPSTANNLSEDTLGPIRHKLWKNGGSQPDDKSKFARESLKQPDPSLWKLWEKAEKAWRNYAQAIGRLGSHKYQKVQVCFGQLPKAKDREENTLYLLRVGEGNRIGLKVYPYHDNEDDWKRDNHDTLCQKCDWLRLDSDKQPPPIENEEDVDSLVQRYNYTREEKYLDELRSTYEKAIEKITSYLRRSQSLRNLFNFNRFLRRDFTNMMLAFRCIASVLIKSDHKTELGEYGEKVGKGSEAAAMLMEALHCPGIIAGLTKGIGMVFESACKEIDVEQQIKRINKLLGAINYRELDEALFVSHLALQLTMMYQMTALALPEEPQGYELLLMSSLPNKNLAAYLTAYENTYILDKSTRKLIYVTTAGEHENIPIKDEEKLLANIKSINPNDNSELGLSQQEFDLFITKNGGYNPSASASLIKRSIESMEKFAKKFAIDNTVPSALKQFAHFVSNKLIFGCLKGDLEHERYQAKPLKPDEFIKLHELTDRLTALVLSPSDSMWEKIKQNAAKAVGLRQVKLKDKAAHPRAGKSCDLEILCSAAALYDPSEDKYYSRTVSNGLTQVQLAGYISCRAEPYFKWFKFQPALFNWKDHEKLTYQLVFVPEENGAAMADSTKSASDVKSSKEYVSRSEHNEVKAQLNEAITKLTKAEGELEKAKTDIVDLQKNHKAKYDELKEKHEELVGSYKKLLENYEQLKEEVDILKEKLNRLPQLPENAIPTANLNIVPIPQPVRIRGIFAAPPHQALIPQPEADDAPTDTISSEDESSPINTPQTKPQ